MDLRKVNTKQKRYGLKHVAEGKCYFCPRPLSTDSKRLCDKHLADSRVNSNKEAKEN